MSEELLTQETEEVDTTSLLTETATTDAESSEQETEVSAEQKSDEPAGAPDEYEAFTLPEEYIVDDDVMSEFKEVAKELNVTQEGAQKLVDLQNKLVNKLAEEQLKTWDDTLEEWKTSSKSDKEFGGIDFDKNLAVANEFLATTSKAFKDMLKATGVGNHPEMIRVAWKIGQMMKEGNIHMGGETSNVPKTPAQILFPSMNT